MSTTCVHATSFFQAEDGIRDYKVTGVQTCALPISNIDEQSLLEQLQVRLVPSAQRRRWDQLVRQHHYLKNARLVGEQLRYVVIDAAGNWLALIGWSAAATHLKARDQSTEWTGRH